MRLIVSFILLGVLQLAQGNVYGQRKHFDLNFDNAPLGTVLNAIESQSKYRFAYSTEFIKLEKEVSIRISSPDINQVLDKLFSGSGIRFEIKYPHIVLLPVGVIQNSPFEKKITGIVKDNKGLPLPGVVVSLDGMSLGVITDTEGKFVLKIPDVIDSPIMVFSFMGMETQRIKIDDSTVFLCCYE